MNDLIQLRDKAGDRSATLQKIQRESSEGMIWWNVTGFDPDSEPYDIDSDGLFIMSKAMRESENIR